jgi:hypothetical protein
MVQAVNAVKHRLIQSTSALESAGIPYALTDDNAIAAWVAQVAQAAVRNTPDVTIIIQRTDFTRVKSAMNQPDSFNTPCPKSDSSSTIQRRGAACNSSSQMSW